MKILCWINRNVWSRIRGRACNMEAASLRWELEKWQAAYDALAEERDDLREICREHIQGRYIPKRFDAAPRSSQRKTPKLKAYRWGG